MDENIPDKSVSELMSSPVRTVEYDIQVTAAARILSRRDIGALVVEDDGIDGVITESDLVDAVAAEHDTERMTVGRLMTSEVVTVDAGTSVEVACETMREDEIKKLPVTEDGDLVGILTVTDVTHALVPDLDDVIVSFQ